MAISKGPVTGYLLIKTETVPENTKASKDNCDGIYEDPLDSIACKIREILTYYMENQKGAVEGPFRGAIVKSDEKNLNIVVSFRARDEETFKAIAGEIENLSAPANSKEDVTEVKTAISNRVPNGFQGPP